MQQHELIPNNTGQKEANHRRLHSLCFPFYKVIGNVKLFTKAYTGGKAIEKNQGNDYQKVRNGYFMGQRGDVGR